MGRRFYYSIFFYFFNIFGLYAIDRCAKQHCSSLEIFWVCSALPHPPACLVSLRSLRYGDYGLRTTAGPALSFVRSNGLSGANIER